jgi:hypothetical protein
MSKLQETKDSLERVQNFDLSKLPRKNELGERFSFEACVEPTQRTINLFRRLPIDKIGDLGDQQLDTIKKNTDAFFNRLEAISQFDPAAPEATKVRQDIINGIASSYNGAFSPLHPLISFIASQATDFSRIELDGRATLQSIRDQTAGAVKQLNEAKDEATIILEEVRKSAAEQGVSQQAYYFHEEAKSEDGLARTWKWRTYGWAALLVFAGIGAAVMHATGFFAPKNPTEAVFMLGSKVIVFATLSYMLVLSSRNFMAHSHNTIVNRHRQNALQTFNALVAAGGTEASRNVILNHAAACIFAPQETGYTKHSSAGSISLFASPGELIPKISSKPE